MTRPFILAVQTHGVWLEPWTGRDAWYLSPHRQSVLGVVVSSLLITIPAVLLCILIEWIHWSLTERGRT